MSTQRNTTLFITALAIGVTLGAVAVGVAVALWPSSDAMEQTQSSVQPTMTQEADEILYWTCGMHPSVRAESGDEKCPICFMDLVPVYASDQAEGGEDITERLRVNEQGRTLAMIETVMAEHRPLDRIIEASGRIAPDERHLSHVHSRVGGWVDSLMVDFTGKEVAPGDSLLTIYSEELVTAQEEYLLALHNFGQLREGGNARATEGAESLFLAARQRLLRWDVTEEQIANLEREGSPSEKLTLHFIPTPDTPDGGVVVDLRVSEGHRVNAGDRLFSVADLGHLWILADVYENDLPLVEVGQSVDITSSAFPGHVHVGEIAFIDPVLDPTTRTARVRVNIENPNGDLRPEMWVNVRLRVPVVTEGSAPDLPAYMCPMQCEGGLAEEPDQHCPVCGMILVPTGEVLGDAWQSGSALTIPDLAVLRTGEREIVYVEVEPGVYERRVITTGPIGEIHSGDRGERFVAVLDGLRAGERVVTRGNFLLDSQSTLTGGAAAAYGSALNATDDTAMPAGHQH